MILLLLLLLLHVAVQSHGWYFEMDETGRKCFIEDANADIIITGYYDLSVLDPVTGNFTHGVPGFGLLVDVEDPNHKQILHMVYSLQGKFTFNTHQEGDYKICLSTNSSRWFSGARVRVQLYIDDGDNFWTRTSQSKSEAMNEARKIMDRLKRKIIGVGMIQDRKKLKEEKYRELSHTVYNTVLGWAVAQGVLIGALGWIQIKRLTAYFIKKKIV